MVLKINLTAILKIAICLGFFKIAAFRKFILFFLGCDALYMGREISEKTAFCEFSVTF